MIRAHPAGYARAALLLRLLGGLAACQGASIRPPPQQVLYGAAGALGNAGSTPDEARTLSAEIVGRNRSFSPVRNVAGAREMNRAIAAVTSRDPRISQPRGRVGRVRAQMDAVLAHPAAPSWEDPHKALLCEDDILVAPLLLAGGLAMIVSGRAKELRKRTRAKAARLEPIHVKRESPTRIPRAWEW